MKIIVCTIESGNRNAKYRKKYQKSSNYWVNLKSRVSFDKENITLHTEYDKIKHFDTNKLLLSRTHYDGILLGPMPHKMKECDNLISRMENEPDLYPAFAVLRDHTEELKITKNSLRKGLQELSRQLENINEYLAG